MLPFASRVNCFFRSRRNFFPPCVAKNRFSQVALGSYAPPRRICQPFFSQSAKFLLPGVAPFRFVAAKGECSPAATLCQTLFAFFRKKPARPRWARARALHL